MATPSTEIDDYMPMPGMGNTDGRWRPIEVPPEIVEAIADLIPGKIRRIKQHDIGGIAPEDDLGSSARLLIAKI